MSKEQELGKMSKEQELGKQLAYILRHKPESVGLTVDPQGWMSLPELATALSLTTEDIQKVVDADTKQRYSIRGELIRANQGHSIPLKMDLDEPESVPQHLYHGTVESALEAILGRSEGLRPMSRQHVHMSATLDTAQIVASRRKGNIVILKIDTEAAQTAGVVFKLSENQVWLTEHIPAHCLRVI